MKYNIQITNAAAQDLVEAADYIKFVLKNPDAAEELLRLTEERINSLACNPKIFPFVNDSVLKAQKIRFLTVKKYVAFYTVDEDCSTVYVIRFLYGKRNWAVLLRDGMPFF